jgi:formamidopyrimidine-DNA glycosylase
MPELPEVETIVQRLHSALKGKRIRSVEVFEPKIFRSPVQPAIQALSGSLIREIRRKGKLIIFALQPEMTLLLHLKMTGQPLLLPASTPIDRHTHVIFDFYRTKVQLRYRDMRKFGFFSLIQKNADLQKSFLGRLGPDPFELTPSRFSKILKQKDRMIKALLLDQSLISGLGNIYVDESLFRAQIHPETRPGYLSEPMLKKLHRTIKTVLNQAIKNKGSTLRNYRQPDGICGGFQDLHQVYGRQGKPCRFCRTPIQKKRVAGRGTHFCPSCQKLNRNNEPFD